MTAIFGFIFLGILAPLIRDRFETGRIKKVRKLEAIDALKGEYSRSKWYIENNVEQSIGKNRKADSEARLDNTIDMGEMRVSVELQKEIQGHNEKLKDYDIFRKASESYIRNSIEAKVRRMFPKTLEKNNELHVMLCSDFFMGRYFNGETVTCNWLRDTEPIMLKNITKDINESEKYELDVLFSEINNEFHNEAILLRFRKQKDAIKDHAKKMAENLQKEIASLDRQLRKYDYLRASEQELEDSSMHAY
jgi:hypothetical protein